MSLTSINLELDEVLRDPVRRQEFFRSITEDDIAEQIRALRKERDLTQAKFAELAGMKQSAVSRIEQAEYASWSWATLCKVAAALDARWRMTLQPCEEAIKEFQVIDVQPTEVGSVVDVSQAAASAMAITPITMTGADLLAIIVGGANRQTASSGTANNPSPMPINLGAVGIAGTSVAAASQPAHVYLDLGQISAQVRLEPATFPELGMRQ
jgi:transcriptional regulator with XRE-family HTH domain